MTANPPFLPIVVNAGRGGTKSTEPSQAKVNTMKIHPTDNPADTVSLAGAAVVRARDADDCICLAAAELSRFLYLLTGVPSPVTEASPASGARLVLSAENPASASGIEPMDRQGYRICVSGSDDDCGVRICGGSPAGALYGAYRLLEELGMGFYAGGETYPDRPSSARLPAHLDLTERPSFRVRGNMLHYNFLCGCTTWGLEDYKFYFDQLARMRCNVLLMHWYDDEPGAAYEWDGEYRAGGRTPNSLAKPWGAQAALRTSQFSFGTGRLFDEEIFSSPAGEDLPDTLTEIKRTEALFSQATAYARSAGIQVAAGFEAPRDDPTDPLAAQRFQSRVQQFLRRNPDITHFALWQHESGGCIGTEPPAPGSQAGALMEQRRSHFTHLGNDQRVWEAIRFGRFAELALDILDTERPDLPMVVLGWGGDRWMRFADYCLGYDKLLPKSVVFTCHDNIEASYGPTVSTPWGDLPPDRERWATVWVENDLDDCQVRQPQVESLGLLAPDALAKGCQGLLTMQWRTRDVEEETAYAAQFAWNPDLTPDSFYQRFAHHSFGPDHQERTAAHIAALQRLGARWTGVRGSVECGNMKWTGWVPHFPFDLNGETADFLVDKLDAAIHALEDSPDTTDSEAAFHRIQNQADTTSLVRSAPQHEAEHRHRTPDKNRPGMREMRTARKKLEQLRGVDDETVLRRNLCSIEEDVFDLRPELVRHGMTSRAYQALDGFLIAIHHLQRNAGAQAHYAELQRIRADLCRLRTEILETGNLQRLERLDYLLATMDFAMHHDRAAMLLADGERIDQALADAEQAAQPPLSANAAAHISAPADNHQSGPPSSTPHSDQTAADIAAAYAELVEAGMRRAIEAFGRKLTTRCDFGTLCTLNVKTLPLYWKTIGRLENNLTAVPPREVIARGRADEVWLSWRPGCCAGQNIHRRLLPEGSWTLVNGAPLQPATACYVDRGLAAGTYEYCITALDENGGESPGSHRASTVCGEARSPRIIACKPAGRSRSGEEIAVRVVAQSDVGIRQIRLVYRLVGDSKWRSAPMLHRFRDSHACTLPAQTENSILEYYVEVTDTLGNRAVWPQTAPNLAWTIVATAADL